MKNLKVYKDVLSKKFAYLPITLVLTSTTLAGCQDKEEAIMEEYDVVEQDNGQNLNAGLTQKLEVPGETFTLITKYSCDPISQRTWRVTSDKFLYLNVYTEGLSDDTVVYIDNIHIDTCIKSKYAAFDGILQDTMDDHVHSSQLIGFSIGNDMDYYGVFAIEGMNQTFIEGTVSGYQKYVSGSVTQKRYTESDYVEEWQVYANKFQVVYDLLVKGPNDVDFRNISVATEFVVPITSNEKTEENVKQNEESSLVKKKVL